MWSHTETVPLPLAVFTILRDLIHERAGIFFEADKRDLLADKLSARVTERGLGSFLDYYYLLKYGPDAESEWLQVLDALSVPETYFWREIAQIHAFTHDILPQYIDSFHSQPIAIWCAACATGEEPLTIAMVLAEAGWFERVPIRIIASDASGTALAKAQRAHYRDRSFRTLPKPMQDKYFTPVAGGWQVSPELTSRVEFASANLMRPEEIDAYACSPFIFCRNVFIYFSDEAIARTVKLFSRRMSRPGYLFVGASESLLRVTTDFDLQAAGEGFVYQLK